MFTKKTIKDIDLNGTRILLRADYNVPLEQGRITDDYRIKQSLLTIRFLLERGCRVAIVSHLGRPDGKPDAQYSLRPVAERLQELLGTAVGFLPDCVGQDVHDKVWGLERSQVVLMENLRFHPEEEQNDDGFGKALASLCEVFVQDGFGVVHRAHASTDAVTRHVYSIAGLLLEREVDTITNVMEAPERPLMAVVGGAKIADKIEIINRFIEIADFIAIGGAMANTFLAAEGINVAHSKYDDADIPTAKAILAKAREKAKTVPFVFYLPQDGVVATEIDPHAHTRVVDWDAHVFADVESYPKKPAAEATKIADNEMILDIGPFSGAFIAGGIQLARTVVWNGTMGVTETQPLMGKVGPFAHGTETVVEAMLGEFGNKPFTVVGGGDTVGYVESQNLVGAFGHVSTGGGASLELMSGRTLPGVAALVDKNAS